MRPSIAHIHLHLPDFEIGGTEQWALAMAQVLATLPYKSTVTAGPRLDETAKGAFHGWEAIAIDDIPANAHVIAPCAIDHLVQVNRQVIAVAHGMNDYYKSLFISNDYYKAVAVSEVARDAFPAGVDVEVVHNGVDFNRLKHHGTRRDARDRLRIPQQALVIGHVGRMSYGKNPLLAAALAGAVPGGMALYVGPPPPPEVTAEAQARADCRFVTASPAHPIADCYAAMDVCLVASRSEGFSLVTVEAWASSTPVISTPVGIALEHPDLVAQIPANSDLQSALEALERAKSLQHRSKVEAAYKIALERYSIPAMADRWRAYLASII